MLTTRTAVLVVDDSATMRKVIRMQLSEIGLRAVKEASGGEAAIEMMKKWTPDIVLIGL